MLNQCTAVASPQYENVFCLGVHAIGDTGQCVVAAAAGRMPSPLYPTLIAANAVSPYRMASTGVSASPATFQPASISDLLDRPTSRVRTFRAD